MPKESIGQQETPVGTNLTETGFSMGPVTAPNTAVASGKVSFGRCILNERCRGPKQSLEPQYPGCNNYISYCCGRILFMNDGYKEGDVLCPSCDKQSDAAVLCLPVTQCDEQTSES